MLHESMRFFLPKFRATNLNAWFVKATFWAHVIGYFLFVHLIFLFKKNPILSYILF